MLQLKQAKYAYTPRTLWGFPEQRVWITPSASEHKRLYMWHDFQAQGKHLYLSPADDTTVYSLWHWRNLGLAGNVELNNFQDFMIWRQSVFRLWKKHRIKNLQLIIIFPSYRLCHQFETTEWAPHNTTNYKTEVCTEVIVPKCIYRCIFMNEQTRYDARKKSIPLAMLERRVSNDRIC